MCTYYRQYVNILCALLFDYNYIYIYRVDAGMVIKVQRRRQVVSGGVGVSPTTLLLLPPRDDGSHNFPFYRYRRISFSFFFKYTFFYYYYYLSLVLRIKNSRSMCAAHNYIIVQYCIEQRYIWRDFYFILHQFSHINIENRDECT